MKSVLVFILFLGLVALTSWIGAQFTPGEWYAALEKPPLNPPNWIFAPVWSALYLAMAIAAWLVWKAERESPSPLLLWGTQLVLNALWSYLFFGIHRMGLALIEILILLGVVVATCVSFFRTKAVAGWLLVPYIAWLLFATYLNAALLILNP
ncbi:MAG: TspO/MBR family protein [Pseudomonadota bacterium]